MKVVPSPKKTTITMKTRDVKDSKILTKWWLASGEQTLCQELLGSAAFLKENQEYRYRQAAIFAKLYGNQTLFNFVGSNIQKLDQGQGLPADRPTFNIVQSAVDTLISKITQDRPSPVFLTDNSNYKERNLAKKLNTFIQGELYQTKAYDKGAIILRDALVEGTGVLKVFETPDNKVALERVLLTELLIDPNEAIYGEPRQIYQLKLVDRDVLKANSPKLKKMIEQAAAAYPDNSSNSSQTISDMVMVVEAWHLPSSKDAGDGRHVIACSSGVILDEEYTKDRFPFVFLHYSDRLLGFWAQGLAEQLMGTQIEINSLLFTISKAIKLVGVPRVFVEDSSKVVSAHLNDQIGSIIKYRGIKPSYEVAPAVPQEMYAQLQRLIDYGYQQAGVSMLQASSQKPAGLNSGEAIRSYDDIASDRFAYLEKKYRNVFIDLAYLIIDLAKDIAERDGKYQTVYPGKDGTKKVDLPEAELLKDPFVIQCFSTSSLPRDPAGRMEKVTEMIQAGMITIKEGRRLLDYPDLEQEERLANAAEERLYQILDKIIDDGEFTPPDSFLDLEFAKTTVVRYINLYGAAALEEDKMQLLRDFYTQVLELIGVAGQAVAPMDPQAVPQALPEQLPTSPLVPNAVTG